MPTPNKKKPATTAEAFARAAARCAVAEQCVADWQRKFLAMGLTPDEAQTVIDRLIDEGYINEERYARAYVHDKANYDDWGSVKIRQKLLQKGFSSSVISRALAEVDDSLWVGKLEAILAKKSETITDENPYVRNEKLIRFASNRGYAPAEIIRVLDHLLEGDPD